MKPWIYPFKPGLFIQILQHKSEKKNKTKTLSTSHQANLDLFSILFSDTHASLKLTHLGQSQASLLFFC